MNVNINVDVKVNGIFQQTFWLDGAKAVASMISAEF